MLKMPLTAIITTTTATKIASTTTTTATIFQDATGDDFKHENSEARVTNIHADHADYADYAVVLPCYSVKDEKPC